MSKTYYLLIIVLLTVISSNTLKSQVNYLTQFLSEIAVHSIKNIWRFQKQKPQSIDIQCIKQFQPV